MAGAQMFPTIHARDLEGLAVELPEAFAGDRNIVAVAFQRQHQALVDSWVPWFDQQSRSDPGLRFYEVPTIGRLWAPARRFIDGGMAAAIREPAILQRTFTVYGDVGRVTRPLGIEDHSTIAVLCVDRAGLVLWIGYGRCTETLTADLESVLVADRGE